MQELLLGPAGCGKTRRVLEIIRDYLARGEGAKLLVLLPTESLVSHFKVLILEKGEPAGFADSFLFTFHRLGYLLAACGNNFSLAKSHQKIWLLEEILNRDCPPNLTGVKDYPGFRQALLNIFRELKEHRVTPATLTQQARTFHGRWGGKSLDRLANLIQLYQDYQRALEAKGWWEAEDLLYCAAGLLSKDKSLGEKKELLIVDGFSSFTAPEEALLQALLKQIPQKLITLPALPPRIPSASLGVFAALEDTLKLLESYPLEKNYLGPPRRFKSEPLQKIAEFFSLSSDGGSVKEETAPAQKSVGGLKVWAAADRLTEVASVAQEILSLVHQAGYNFADIGVILRQPRLYLDIFRQEFALLNIPWRYWGQEPLSSHPWVKSALELGNLYCRGWERERVLRLLKSGYFDLELLEVDFLELKARRYSLNNEKQWRQWGEKQGSGVRGQESGVGSQGSGVGGQETGDRGQGTGVLNILNRLGEYSPQFQGKARGAVWAERYRELLEKLMLPGAVRSSANIEGARPTGSGPLLGVETFLGMVEELREYLKDQEITFTDYLYQLNLAVKAREIFIPDRRRQAVNLIGVHEARQWELPVVFIVGLVEGEFPAPCRENLFIKDFQRKALKDRGGVDLPLSSAAGDEELLFYLAATRARERLYLTYPSGGGQRKEFLASYLLQEIEALFAPLAWQEIFTLLPPPGESPPKEKVHSLSSLSFFVLGKEKENTLEGQAARWLLQYNQVCSWSRIKTLPSYKDFLNLSLAKPPDKTFNVSELETFAQCPRLYFYKYILDLEPLELTYEEDQEPTLWGSLAHEVLRAYYCRNYLEKEKAGRIELKDLMEEIWEKYSPRIPCGYLSLLEKERLSRTLLLFLEREKARSQLYPFVPSRLEWKFGRGETAPLLIESSEGPPLKISGAVDRLDVHPEKASLVMVVDYKYSKQINRFKDNLKAGRELQIPLYIMAARELLGYEPAGGLLYYLKINEPGESFKDMTGIGREAAWPAGFGGKQVLRDSEEGWQAILDEVKNSVAALVSRLRQGDIRATPEYAAYCGAKKCPFFDLCSIRERE